MQTLAVNRQWICAKRPEGELRPECFELRNGAHPAARPGQALAHLISVLNVTGLAAYFGLLDIGGPKPGVTVLVSAAARAVGCIAVQLASLAGCRVVGVARGADKCRRLSEELGVHAVVDCKVPGLREALAAACH